MNARGIALYNVTEILEEKKPLHIVLKESLDGIEDEKERAFTARLTRGCVERVLTLDSILNRISKVKTEKMKPAIRNILRISLYQILFMDAAPDFAVCNEAVKLTAKRGLSALKGFVNGVLRNICRRKEEFLSEIYSEGTNMSFRFSVPEWIKEEYIQEFGKQKTYSIFCYYLKDNPVSVRFNTSVDPAFAKWEKEQGIEKNPYLNYCGYLKGAGAVEKLEGFKNGSFTVQDLSSVLAGFVADSAWKSQGGSGKSVLDLCAAPGGKSLHMADMGYEVVSCDISERKTALIDEAAKRCGFKNISVMVNDALVYNPEFEKSFDVVICDLPCSGLGIIGKKPDIKYNMTPEKSLELAVLQKDILKNAVRYIKDGGVLVYSTCTLRKCENTENAEYIKKELGLTGIPVKEHLPKEIVPKGEEDCYIQILPGEYGSDGFFISCFKKA